MADVHKNVCVHAMHVFYARSVHFQQNTNGCVPSRELVEHGDISPQALDVLQKGENIYCLLFIMSLVAVVELVQIVSEELTWITKCTHEKLYLANWSQRGPSLLGTSC